MNEDELGWMRMVGWCIKQIKTMYCLRILNWFSFADLNLFFRFCWEKYRRLRTLFEHPPTWWVIFESGAGFAVQQEAGEEGEGEGGNRVQPLAKSVSSKHWIDIQYPSNIASICLWWCFRSMVLQVSCQHNRCQYSIEAFDTLIFDAWRVCEMYSLST